MKNKQLAISACLLALSGAVHAATENWQFAGALDFPMFQGDMTGLYRTQGITLNPAANEWVFAWQYGLERTTADFQSLQRTGSLNLATMTVTTGIPAVLAAQGFDHIGDSVVHDGILYASLDSEAGDYQNGHVALFNAADLSYTGTLHQLNGAPSNPRDDVASWVAVDGVNGLGYGKEWKNGNTINVYNLSDWSFSHTLTMDRSLRNIQGGKVFNGALYMSSHNSEKSVYRLDLDTGHVDELFQLPKVANAFNETEGIALRALPGGGAEMWVEMIVEPDANQLESTLKLYRYTLQPVPLPAGLPLMLSGLGAAAALLRRRAT